MTDTEKGKPKEYRKIFKNYELVIDKGNIITAIVGTVAIVLLFLGLLYLAGVFK